MPPGPDGPDPGFPGRAGPGRPTLVSQEKSRLKRSLEASWPDKAATTTGSKLIWTLAMNLRGVNLKKNSDKIGDTFRDPLCLLVLNARPQPGALPLFQSLLVVGWTVLLRLR